MFSLGALRELGSELQAPELLEHPGPVRVPYESAFTAPRHTARFLRRRSRSRWRVCRSDSRA